MECLKHGQSALDPAQGPGLGPGQGGGEAGAGAVLSSSFHVWKYIFSFPREGVHFFILEAKPVIEDAQRQEVTCYPSAFQRVKDGHCRKHDETADGTFSLPRKLQEMSYGSVFFWDNLV